ALLEGRRAPVSEIEDGSAHRPSTCLGIAQDNGSIGTPWGWRVNLRTGLCSPGYDGVRPAARYPVIVAPCLVCGHPTSWLAWGLRSRSRRAVPRRPWGRVWRGRTPRATIWLRSDMQAG